MELFATSAGAEGHQPAEPQALLESVFASLSDGLILFGPDGGITRLNARARELLGCGEGAPATLADLHGQLGLLDLEGQPVPVDGSPAAAALRGQAMRAAPYVVQLADGRRAWVLLGAAPVRGPGGQVVGAVMTVPDVERLRELQEQREDLARMISHDLRAPLNVILAQARLVGRRSDGPEALRARAEAIATSAQRMAIMLDDLVESALLESGKLRLDREPTDVAALVRDLRTRLAAPYGGERVRLAAEPAVPPAWADPARLERVLVNLLTNALKYSAPGSEVVVRLLAEGGQVTLEVEDQGPGIAAGDVPHLFERYFRALGTSRADGLGLGLYTARMLAEAHGGSLTASSVEGRGSVFRLRLPVAGPRPPGQPAPAPLAPGPEKP